ncbi:MAG: glycoside hydrolase family 2 protein, partial [Oscillospiraceae bacterium]|nr:glycoside hydrolase family 2 protein [Oscillospiraceae bacterium]
LRSADGKLHIQAEPEEKTVKPGEIVYIPVFLAGENGVVESNNDRKLTVTVEGGELLAFGSANPCTEERYDSGSFTTYYGHALAVARAGQAGTLRLTATDGTLTGQAEVAVL